MEDFILGGNSFKASRLSSTRSVNAHTCIYMTSLGCNLSQGDFQLGPGSRVENGPGIEMRTLMYDSPSKNAIVFVPG